MKILFCGDVVGKSGRDAVLKYLPKIVDKLSIDFTIVNAENSAHGFGITPEICDQLFKSNIDALTLGNHAFDKPEIKDYLNQNHNIIRPINFDTKDGVGINTFVTKNGIRVTVINILCKVFVHSKIEIKDPFVEIKKVLEEYELKSNTDVIFIDIHGETTSEKLAFANFLDGKVSAVIGTHTHTPSADYRILKNGTAYQTDVGMCGDYDSVIGMEIENSLSVFLNPGQKRRFNPASKEGTIAACVISVDTTTGLANDIKPVVFGKHLFNTISL